MLSSADVHWTLLVVVILCSEGLHSVTVTVSHIVYTDHNATNLTLPCEYVLDNPDHACNIRWEKDGDTVIVKNTVGQIFVGHRYRNRALWGDDCSLILLYPGLNDAGRYTFTAFAPDDRKDTGSAHTQVTVGLAAKSSRETTTEVTSASHSTDPNTVAVEDGHNLPVWVTSVPVTAIGVVFLVAHVVLTWWNERRGLTDIKHRLLLGGVVVVLFIGITAGIAGMALRNTVVTVVGQYFVYLGIVSHIPVISAFCCTKTKAPVSRKSKGSLLTDEISTKAKGIPTKDMANVVHPPDESEETIFIA